MIRIIQESEQTQVLEMLRRDTCVNYFMVLSCLWDSDKLSRVLGVYTDNTLTGVLLIRRSGNAHLYSKATLNLVEIETFLEENQVDALILENTQGQLYRKAFNYPLNKQATVMTLIPMALKKVPTENTSPIKAIESTHAKAIKALYTICFKGSLSEALIEKNLKESTGRGLAIFDGETIISVVQTIFETKDSAILFGIATHPDCRGRGFSSQLLNALLGSLVLEGKTLHLLVEDSVAMALYAKCGFRIRTTIVKVDRMKVSPIEKKQGSKP